MDIDRGWNGLEYSRDGWRKGAVRARVKAAQFSTFVLVENRVVVALVNVSY
jgi:hypothetical protein